MADDDLKIYENNANILMYTQPPWNIIFNNKKNEEIGRLEFDDQGYLSFSGDADQAARVFFDCVVKLNNERTREIEETAKMGYEVVEDFLPNIGKCVLQDYGRMNTFMVRAKELFGD